MKNVCRSTRTPPVAFDLFGVLGLRRKMVSSCRTSETGSSASNRTRLRSPGRRASGRGGTRVELGSTHGRSRVERQRAIARARVLLRRSSRRAGHGCPTRSSPTSTRERTSSGSCRRPGRRPATTGRPPARCRRRWLGHDRSAPDRPTAAHGRARPAAATADGGTTGWPPRGPGAGGRAAAAAVAHLGSRPTRSRWPR